MSKLLHRMEGLYSTDIVVVNFWHKLFVSGFEDSNNIILLVMNPYRDSLETRPSQYL